MVWPLRTLKEPAGQNAEKAAADVSRVSDTTGRLDIGHGANLIENLDDEPDPDHECGRRRVPLFRFLKHLIKSFVQCFLKGRRVRVDLAFELRSGMFD